MRDDFPAKVRSAIAARAGYRCSNPGCRRVTSGPRSEPDKSVDIGVAAHISAASPQGPRYSPDISSKKRQSINNAIWLCQNCAKLVDNDQSRYTTQLLQDWKGLAEGNAHAEIAQPLALTDFSSAPGFSRFLELLVTFIDLYHDGQREITIAQFISWISSREDIKNSPAIRDIVSDLRVNPASGEVILRALIGKLVRERTILSTAYTDNLSEQVKELFENLLNSEISQKEKHRLEVSARLLEIASRNPIGSGMRADLHDSFTNPSFGTLAFRWRIGEASPDMMLVELVGGVLESRISILLRSNSSLCLRAYDPVGRVIRITSQPYATKMVLQVGVTWNKQTLTFWINGKLIGEAKLTTPFVSPWMMLLAGIDIEGDLSADIAHQGYEIEGLVGLNLGKADIWHGAQIRDTLVWNIELSRSQLIEMAEANDQEVEQLKSLADGNNRSQAPQ